MSEELQSESGVIEQEVEVTEQVTEPVEASESATDSESQHEQNGESSSFNQEAVNKRFSELTFKQKQAEREAEELRAKVEKYESTYSVAPEIPPMPDEFDDNFSEKLKARESAIAERARFDAEQAVKQQAAQQQQQQAALQRQSELTKKRNTYFERASKDGITEQELLSAADAVVIYGVKEDVQEFILDEPEGPAITKYLAANPADALQLAGMNPMQAAIYVRTELTEKAKALKPKSSEAPPPVTKVDGGSADPDLGKYPHIKGATID